MVESKPDIDYLYSISTLGWVLYEVSGESAPLGRAIFPDSTALPFYDEDQLAAWQGKTKITGCMHDHGVQWHERTGDRHYPCAEAEAAREALAALHGGLPVFLSEDTWLNDDDGNPRNSLLTFAEAVVIAEAEELPSIMVRRGMCGLATVTARKSAGPPAPRSKFSLKE